MDSLFNILSRKDYDLPSEAVAIKAYVRQEFESEVEVIVRTKEIIISGRSSSLIGSLRLRGPAIKRLLDSDKRLVFRVG